MAVSRLSLRLPRHVLFGVDRRALERIGIVGVACVVTVYIASHPDQQLRALVVLLGIGATILLICWPRFGIGCLIASAILVPFGIGTGTQTKVNAAVILVGLLTVAWLVEGLLSRGIQPRLSTTVRPLIALIVVSLIAFVNGLQPWTVFADLAPIGAQLGGLMVFVLSVCAFLLGAFRVRDLRMLSRLTWLFLALAALCTVDRIGVLPLPSLRALYGTGASGSMFWLCMVALAFSQGVFNRQLARSWRVCLLALVGVYLLFAIGRNRDWTSGWAPELVAIVVILWIGSVRAGIVASVAAAIVILPNVKSITNLLFFSNAKNQYDVLTRQAAWSILGEIIKLNPILGVGFANYYHYTPLFPILGYAAEFNSHNNYIDVVAQTGLVGLACLAWFFFELFRLAWRLRARVEAGFGQAYVYGIIGLVPAVLVASFLGDWFLPFVYNIGLAGFRASVHAWLFLGGLLVVESDIARRTGRVLELPTA